MKIFPLFILISIAFSFINCTTYTDVLESKIDIDTNKLTKSLSKECIEEDKNSEYSICVPKITLSNYKESCKNVKSEKCQTFYNDPDKSKYYPKCSTNPLYNEYLQPQVINYIKNELEMQCLTDENQELCPVALYEIQSKSIFSDPLYDNCSSKQCTDELIEIYKELHMDQYAALESISTSKTKFSYSTLTSIKDSISYVNSDNCKKLHKTSMESNIENNAIANKFNSIFSTILIILLLLYYTF